MTLMLQKALFNCNKSQRKVSYYCAIAGGGLFAISLITLLAGELLRRSYNNENPRSRDFAVISH